jgi:hypothetical protein
MAGAEMNTTLRHVVSLAAIAVGLFSGNAMGETKTVNEVLNVKFGELDLVLASEDGDEYGDFRRRWSAPVVSDAGSSLSYLKIYRRDLFEPGVMTETNLALVILPLSQPDSGVVLDEVNLVGFDYSHGFSDPPEDSLGVYFAVNSYGIRVDDIFVNVNPYRSWVNFGDSDIYFSDIPLVKGVGRLIGADYTFDSLHSMHVEYAVTYYNVSSVPEPETYAMLLAGLGIVGTAVRRRHLTRR